MLLWDDVKHSIQNMGTRSLSWMDSWCEENSPFPFECKRPSFNILTAIREESLRIWRQCFALISNPIHASYRDDLHLSAFNRIKQIFSMEVGWCWPLQPLLNHIQLLGWLLEWERVAEGKVGSFCRMIREEVIECENERCWLILVFSTWLYHLVGDSARNPSPSFAIGRCHFENRLQSLRIKLCLYKELSSWTSYLIVEILKCECKCFPLCDSCDWEMEPCLIKISFDERSCIWRNIKIKLDYVTY